MKPIVNVFLASALSTTMLTVGGYSIAASAGRNVVQDPAPYGHATEPTVSPISVDAQTIFGAQAKTATQSAAPKCMSTDDVLRVFGSDVQQVGGEILALSGGLQQQFADQWRREAGVKAVGVSEVYAHIVPAKDGDSVVDVVEMDKRGCALSRTLLSGNDWLDLIQLVKGVEV